MGNAILGILIILGIFAFLIPFISKIFGMSVRQKYSSNVITPDTFDENIKRTKKALDSSISTVTQETDKLSKQIKGTYKFLFDKCQKLSLNKKHPEITLSRFLEIRNNIEILELKKQKMLDIMAQPFVVSGIVSEINSLKTEHNENYIPFIKGIQLLNYVELLSSLFKVDNNSASEMIDIIGFENIRKLNFLIQEIETSYLRQDISKEQRKILRKVIKSKLPY